MSENVSPGLFQTVFPAVSIIIISVVLPLLILTAA